MKLIISALVLFSSLAVSAAELKVLEVPSSFFGRSNYTELRFEVDGNGSDHGVSITAHNVYGSAGEIPSVFSNFYEAKVAALRLEGNDLIVNIDGEDTVCGTMGVTRILKRPALRLSQKCFLKQRQVKNKTEVYIVTKN